MRWAMQLQSVTVQGALQWQCGWYGGALLVTVSVMRRGSACGRAVVAWWLHGMFMCAATFSDTVDCCFHS